MRRKAKFIVSITEIILGIVLILTESFTSMDSYWSGMGTALLFVGILQLIRHIRYKTDQSYQENVDIAVNDERNKYISMKAWSWAGYIFVLIAAVASIVLKVLGYEELVFFASGSCCLAMILYWVSYLVLRRKY